MPVMIRHAAQSFRKIAEACLPLNIAKRITGVEKSVGITITSPKSKIGS
jgi:hypothetical protein